MDTSEITVARHSSPSSSALRRVITRIAVAPSFIPGALPAVIAWVPYIGFNLESLSKLVSDRYCSSISNTLGSPFASGIARAIISSLNFPTFQALP
ncbi:hypothetical protein ES703_54470 [subsurface metagenome]